MVYLIVKDIMRREPFAMEDELATTLRAKMRELDLRSIPVVDDEGKLVGVIGRKDLLRVTSGKSMILVKGIASPPIVTCSPDSTIEEVAREMIEKDVAMIPVVKENFLLGFLTIEDVLRVVSERKPERGKISVSEVMSKEVEICSPEDSLTKVWTRMEETGFSGFPVLRDGKLVGIVTRKDIMESGSIRLELESEKGRFRNPPKVKRVMKHPVITLKQEDTIEKAKEIMLSKKIGRIPVVDNKGKLVGIVDREDILRAYLGMKRV